MAQTQAQKDFLARIAGVTGVDISVEDKPEGSGYTSETLPRAIINPRERYSASGAMENIGPSASAYGESLISIAKDPAKFAEAIGMLFTKEGLESLKGYYADTYGSTEKAMRKAYSDPVGFMSDVSIFGGPLNIAGKLMKIGSKGVGKTVSKIGTAIEAADPASAATAATIAGVSNLPGVRSFPERTYETNLKMGTSPSSKYSDPKVRERVIKTLLDEQIPISPEGAAKLDSVISKRTAELDALIAKAEADGKTISVSQILKPLKELRNEISDPKTNPRAIEQAAAIEEFAMNWLSDLGPVRELTPSQARALRMNLDKQIRWGKKDTVTPPIQRQITEEMASGAREGLRSAVEGYGQTGMDISRLLEAQEPLIRASSRMGQNNTLGLRQAIGMGAGAAVGTGGDAFNQILGVLMAGGAAVMTPQNKERLARLIYRTRDLTADQKRTLLGYIGTQSGPMVQRIEQGESE